MTVPVPLPASRPESRVALLGCGAWGRNLARAFAGLGALAAVHDTADAAAAAVAASHGVPALGLDAILGDPGIDGVVIAASAVAHADLALMALARGKHVFVEKPLALDPIAGERVVAAGRAAGRVVMVGHLLQYHPAFVALLALVRAGGLGRLRRLASNRLNLGRLRHEEDVLWSFAPHDLSMILALTGREPATVSTVGGGHVTPGIADFATVQLGFDDGIRAQIQVSWLHPVKEQTLVVVGEDAMAVFDDGAPWARKLMIYPHRLERVDGIPVAVKAEGRPVALDEAEPLRQEARAFLDAIAGTASPPSDGAEGLRVLRVLHAAARSMAEGRPVALSAPAAAVGIHPTAVIDPPADIGEGTRIWHFSHVLKGSRIGRNCTIGQNVTVGPDVTIGDDCKIQNNVSVYKGVTLEDGVFCGPSCVFTNVNTPRARIDRRDDFRPTLVRANASIGANATIVCGHTIGAYALVAAGAVVTADVPPHALVAGVPARRIGWVSHAGDRLGPDLVCPREGRRYREIDDTTLVEITG